ncbi:rhamnogalacturonan acetylesterase [Mucilaginibacter robiniae]|uniref:Rhamnogalacturonan acetylesterase n=1 Tax=Mucilaginibacter robiniae TaxID=2728022 RepID=A0A7L5DVX8_9SPHI|nr:rhamnogalacturonan acetylesterase [Mucilaginibacter robiniae]QJD95242.1 rhamnogalacturonan acetylesterase [Mucilaginibacter robiniae]
MICFYKKFVAASLGLAFAVGTAIAQVQSEFPIKFNLSNQQAPKGYKQVTTTTAYNNTTGYGYDFDTKPTAVNRKGKAELTTDFVTSDKPFYFSVNVPEGNYRVTLTLGDINGTSLTTVKAESRRLMLEKVATQKEQIKKVSFIVNIRKPQISTGGRVSLKPREIGKLDWDDKLTLEFSDTKPCVDAIEIEKADNQTTIYLAGNSTVVDQDDEPWASWGQMITRFFKPGVAIADHAESGLSLGSFLGSHRLDKILSLIKPGDYLFIEFGHNDQKEKGPEDGAYGSYTQRFKLFINKVRERQGIPVIVTSTARRSFSPEGKTINTLGDYPAAARKVASEEKVALIDLNAMSTQFYDALGVEKSTKAFVYYPAYTFPGQDKPLADDTHFNGYGAYELAKCVLEGIKANHLGIEKYIINAPTFNPSQPDPVETFSLPLSPKSTAIKPDGN